MLRLVTIVAAILLVSADPQLTLSGRRVDLDQPGRALLGGKHNKTTGGCNPPLVAVTNQLTKGGIDCSACLSRTAKKEKQTCDPRCSKHLERGQEFFFALPQLPVTKVCGAITTCYNGGRPNNATCSCCGPNLGYDYSIAPAAPGDPYYDQYGPLAGFKKNCADPVIGEQCWTCTLWRKLRGTYTSPPSPNAPSCDPTAAGQCFQTVDNEHTVMATSAQYDPGHYLLLPGSKTANWPVIGIEDPQVLTKKLEKIWDLAWQVAYKPYSALSGNIPFGSMPGLPVAPWSCQIGIGLNPASARSMHQMHIHVARIPDPVRKVFQGRRKNFGKWTRTTIPISNPNPTNPNQWTAPIVYAKYFSLAGKQGPSKYQIFHQIFAFANFDFLQMSAFGVMLIPDELGYPTDAATPRTPKGFYLVISANNNVGSWNSMKVTAVNNGFQPENLLCNDWSTNDGNGGGNFWTRAECGGAPGLLTGPPDTLY